MLTSNSKGSKTFSDFTNSLLLRLKNHKKQFDANKFNSENSEFAQKSKILVEEFRVERFKLSEKTVLSNHLMNQQNKDN